VTCCSLASVISHMHLQVHNTRRDMIHITQRARVGLCRDTQPAARPRGRGRGRGSVLRARRDDAARMRDNCDSDGTHSTQQTSGSFVPSVLAYSIDIVI
jgi:hypothetical protein